MTLKAFYFNIMVSSLEFACPPSICVGLLQSPPTVQTQQSSQLEILKCLCMCECVCVCARASCDGLGTSPGWILASQ